MRISSKRQLTIPHDLRGETRLLPDTEMRPEARDESMRDTTRT